MKIKVSETTNIQLDWLVAKCEDLQPLHNYSVTVPHPYYEDYDFGFTPSEDWSQGGPIIEREKISIRQWTNVPIVHAYMPVDDAEWSSDGESPLIAAMRCFVVSKLGDEVEVPDELA